MKPMFRYFFDLVAARWNKKAIGITALRLLTLLRNSVSSHGRLNIDFAFLEYANRLPISTNTDRDFTAQAVFVATQKDFLTLPFAVLSALHHLGVQKDQVLIIVPEEYFHDLNNLLRQYDLDDIHVIKETFLIPKEVITELKGSMGSRFGWGLQQFLKIQAVLTSESEFIFLCDADTILLNSRDWFDPKNILLFPTFEKNKAYYKFLEDSFGFGGNPKSSFVSHHMIIQKSLLREAFVRFNDISVEKLIQIVLQNADFKNPSAFSLDYEFYAQYVSEYHPTKIKLEKWSNIGIPFSYFKIYQRSTLFRWLLTKNFQSVSFHSWS